jgi:hypothetical protein
MSISTSLAALALALGSAGAQPVKDSDATVPPRPEVYAPVTLNSDLSSLTANEKRMLGLFIDAAVIMDDLFWQQNFGEKAGLLDRLPDPQARRFAEINYGPWDRLDGNKPFVAGFGPKPPGANFYPHDMTREEFERAELADKRSLYTVLRRDEKGALRTVPYSVEYAGPLKRAAALLEEAAGLAEQPSLARYLEARSAAFLSNEYRASEIAWLDMKDNRIEVVLGPIENYDDELFGYKTAFEAFVLVKDMEWSRRLARYAKMLPDLQRGLPVPEKYKAESPGTDSDLNAYDVVYYAGQSNAGSKTIAVNLPNDEKVQLEKGTRRLQLKNAMRTKYDQIMLPIARELIAEDQLRHVTFDAFFADVMFHEVAHGLGIKNTVNGKGPVRAALKERYAGIEEGKADILGLYMITRLHDQGEIGGALEDYYVTFLAGIFRSVRFGASSAHGQANMVRFNYFAERGAFTHDAKTGRYRVDVAAMRKAVDSLAGELLVLQGDGDYEGAGRLFDHYGRVGTRLESDLARLASRNIPVDVVFRQGREVLGLQ